MELLPKDIVVLMAEVFDLRRRPVTLNAEVQRTAARTLGDFWMLDALLNCLGALAEEAQAARQGVEELHERADAILNTGHYSEVEERFRLLYALVCVCRAACRLLDHDAESALRACDDGLLKGYELDADILARLAANLTDRLEPLELPKFESAEAQPPAQALEASMLIDEIELPSLEAFYRDYFAPQKPVIIKGMVSRWPCYAKWSFEYLHSLCGRRMVPVEFGRRYTDEDFAQRLMPFGAYLRKYVAPARPATVAYLAQHRLLDQVPALRADVLTPDYCALAADEGDEPELLNVFIGPATTVSPLHTDPRHNFFCQIRGRKFVRLIASEYAERTYPFDSFLQSNSSRVDVERPDYDAFPRFRGVRCEDYELEAGDCLFIPRRYMHYVRALEPSINVSIWFG